MENREALLNAGFNQFQETSWMCLINDGAFRQINTCHKSLQINIYKNEADSCANYVVIAKDLEDVKNILYGFLGYYLDFTAKPKYDWETVKEELENHKSIFEDCFNSIDKISAYGWISKQEALSMIAKLKLNIIIQQIDKDYPPVPTETVMGGIRYQDGELQVHYFQDGYSAKNSKVVTATIEGAQILLDQNPQLLKNLFKIETDA